MSIQIGQQLGFYEITALLGKGGMGEVYRAKDNKLKREVAIKILPEEFSRDLDRAGRFQREAELLAALNHPNIAAIYDVVEIDNARFLVLELVEGETLLERIRRGPIPVAEALTIASRVCEALEAAHEKGIIHRDLKPANVKITPDGKVKVLDFGLAKALEHARTEEASNSPTLLSLASVPGLILGTAGYMSPEQARGHDVDQRTDIFSFGCLLFETLTARQPFQGETVTDIIASVVKSDPDFRALPGNVHPKAEELIRRCLAKNRKDRYHAIADVRLEIEAILAESQGLRPADLLILNRPPLWKRIVPLAASAALAAGLASAVVWNIRTTPSSPIARFGFVFPEGQNLTRGGRQVVAISSDGQNLVYQANRQLYLRKISDVESRPIEGTTVDAANPFFSPDGLWIGFYAVGERRLKKVALTGGAAIAIAEVDFPYGASWSSDDQILLADPQKGILRVSAKGGSAETIIAAKPGEVMHGPELLPDRDHVLFTISTGPAGAGRWDKAQVVAQSLKSGERRPIIGGADARYVPTGHLVYALGATVFAIAFDLNALAVKGGPVPIIEGVNRSFNASGTAHFAFAGNGTMAFILGTAANPDKLVLVSEKGMRQVLPATGVRYREPRISPNGKQAAWVSFDESANGTIWIYDLGGSTAPRRLTFENSDYPLWTPDSKRIIFTSRQTTAGGPGALMWQNADGTGTAEVLVQSNREGLNVDFGYIASSIYGKTLAFRAQGNGSDIWQVSLDGDHTPKPLISLPADQNQAAISPDGHWIAYTSTETGRSEVFVQPFPITGAKYQVTSNNPAFIGSGAPLWSPDGRLFYVNFGGGAQLSSFDVATSPNLSFSNPKMVMRLAVSPSSMRNYDLTPDGKQFLIILRETDTPDARQPEMRITLNWFEDIKSHFRAN